jgi:hypothetical protein
MAIMNANVLRVPATGSHGGWRIGTDVHTLGEVCIPPEAQQTHVVGVSGSGKTTALLNLMLQDLRAGRSFALVEPHGDLTRAVIASMPENTVPGVVLLNLMECGEYPFSLNIFQCPEPRTIMEVAKTASQVFHIFAKAWGIGPQTPALGMVLRHVTRTLISARATFAEIPLLLQDEAVRAAMVKHVTNPHTRAFWEAYNRKSSREKSEFTASTLNKVDAYLQEGIGNILSQERSSIDFRRIMDQGKILLVLLSPQLEEMSRLIGSMVIAGILRAAFSREDTPEDQRKQFSLYIDEFQSFLTEDTAVLIHEARKWRLSPVVLSHQALGQLDEANRAAVAGASTRIVFRVSPEDAKELAGAFDTTPTREIVGEEPVRAPTSDVIGHLIRGGHNNPLVAKFIDYLSCLESLVKHVAFSHNIEFGCCLLADGGFVEHGKRQLNNTLYQCMLTGRSDLVIPPLALFILGGAADDGITEVFRQYMLYSQQCFNGFTPDANYLGHPSFLSNEPVLKGFLKHYARRRFWDSVLSYRIVTPGPSFVRMLTTLRQTMAILALPHEQILVATGQYQPKYQQRTYADMLGQIANELSQLPNYHAKVKLLAGEHTIKTFPPPKGIPERQIQKRIARIKHQNRFLGITRPAAEIAEEVRKRHERLQGNG